MKKLRTNRKRQVIQWSLLWIMLLTLALGWKYPILGYSVPLVMVAGIIGSLVRGRYVCGNLCPRGSFLDRMMSKVSQHRHIPAAIRAMPFRWVIMAGLMGFMLYRGLQHPADPAHWGYVFWTMCAVTTAVAVVGALLIHPRTWCAFCPMGTMQNAIGGAKGQLLIDAGACKGCKLCERVCAFDISIVSHRERGVVENRDCLKCSECTTVCPTKALTWPT